MFQVGLEFKVPDEPQRDSGSTPFPVTAIAVALLPISQLPVVLLGRDLTIRRSSPQAEKQFDLIDADVRRPIGHIRHNLVLGGAAETPVDLEALGGKVIFDQHLIKPPDMQKVSALLATWHGGRPTP